MKAIKQILAGIFIGICALIIGMAGYFYFNQDKIVEILIKEVNKKVNTQIDVKEVSMSFFERFPSISVKFDDVTVYGSEKTGNNIRDTLLRAGSLFFDLDLKTLITDKPQIRRLAISNGKLKLLHRTDGTTNYDILKTAEPDQKAGGSLQVDAFEINNLKVLYRDLQQKISYTNLLDRASIKGLIRDDYWSVKTEITISQTNLIPAQYNFYEQYSWEGKVQEADGLIEWNGTLEAGSQKATVHGVYNSKNNQVVASAGDLALTAHTINKILEVNGVNTFRLKGGKTQISQLRYTYKSKFDPQLSLGFNANHNTIIDQKSFELQGQGRLIYNGKNTLLRIATADVKYKSSTAHFEGSYSFPAQKIDGWSSFTADLEDFNGEEASNLPVKNFKGILDGQARINTRIKPNMQYGDLVKEGDLGFQNVSFTIAENDFRVEDLNALLDFSPRKVMIDSLDGIFNQNRLLFNGKVDNLFAYLQKSEPINIRGNVRAQHFDLGKFLLMSEDTSTNEPFRLTDDIRLDITFNAREIVQDQFKAQNFATHFRKFGRRLELENLHMHTSDGAIEAKGKLLQQQNNEWYVELAGDIKNVNVSGIFREMKNFGQKYITANNLAGNLSADVQADFVFYPNFNIRPETLYLITDLKIENGALIDYKTLEALSDYIDVEELQHVKFKRLENQISITNQKITIPYMEVRSSAIDLGLSGTHTFNNDIDYQVSVGLADVLFRKFRRKHREANVTRKNNKMMVFVDITGTTEDYKIDFSKLKRQKVEPFPEKQKIKKKKFEIEFEDLR